MALAAPCRPEITTQPINNNMKTTLKTTLALLSFAIIAVFTFSGCASTGGGSGSGVHHMDTPKRGSTMPDSAMPGGR